MKGRIRRFQLRKSYHFRIEALKIKELGMTDDYPGLEFAYSCIFFETGITIISESESVVSRPKQASTFIFEVWVFTSEFF